MTARSEVRSRRWAAAALAALVPAIAAGCGSSASAPTHRASSPTPSPTHGSPVVSVSVQASHVLGTVGPDAVGADTPFWNSHLTDPDTVRLMREAGIRTLGFDPGGAVDVYDWRTNSLLPDPDRARDLKAGQNWDSLTPKWSFARFEATARAAGATTFVHVNYGTGTPQSAAAWVHNADVVHHDGISNWIIGEEVYLDQFIEPNRRVPATKRSPQADGRDYGTNVIAFARAMKAADPSIRIGVSAFAAAPVEAKHSGEVAYFLAWTKALLATPGLARAIDFVDVHYLGDFAPTIAGELGGRALLPAAFGGLRSSLDAEPGGRRVQIVAGEVNSAGLGASYLETQGNAAFLADTELDLLDLGVAQTDWYTLYNGPDGPVADDFGLLSSGVCVHKRCESKAGTPFPPFWAQRLVGLATPSGAQLLAASASNPDVSAYATRHDGRLAVVLVNRSTRAVRADVGALPGTLDVSQAASGHGITTSHVRGPVTLPSYSVTLVTAG